MQGADVCIVGAGIIGLSLALEMDRRGAEVTVLERDTPMLQASRAAAGMLAAHDPENPAELLALAEMSLRFYPGFLRRVERLSGNAVPFQTSRTYQVVDAGGGVQVPEQMAAGGRSFLRLEEHSVDPRQLAAALLRAVRGTGIRIVNHAGLRKVSPGERRGALRVETAAGALQAEKMVHTVGAWSASPVTPRKGQMLSVRVPASMDLDCVVRTPEVYVVPRRYGPRAGQAVIGATVEDAGFDTSTDVASLRRLRALAAALLPGLGDEAEAPMVGCWAGLRPHTPNLLPLMGQLRENEFLATGHYRNGILLAPATAHVMAQVICGKIPDVDLAAFAPALSNDAEGRRDSPIFAHEA